MASSLFIVHIIHKYPSIMMNKSKGTSSSSHGRSGNGQSLFAGIGMAPSASGHHSRSSGGATTMGGGDYHRTSIGNDGASPMLRYSPGRGSRNAEKDRLVAMLEIERNALLDRVSAYEKTVDDLRSEINQLVVRVSSKKDLRKRYNWTKTDDTYSDAINKFCKEWLFSRYKFFHNDWMTYSEERKSLSFLVLKHCAVPVGLDRRNAWERIAAPTIASKYANMRCNVNNELKKTFLGE